MRDHHPTIATEETSHDLCAFKGFLAGLGGEVRRAYEALAVRDRAFGEDVRSESAADPAGPPR